MATLAIAGGGAYASGLVQGVAPDPSDHIIRVSIAGSVDVIEDLDAIVFDKPPHDEAARLAAIGSLVNGVEDASVAGRRKQR